MKKNANPSAGVFSELEAMRRTQRINNVLLEKMSDLVTIHRLSDLKYEYVNPAALRILGFTQEELYALSPFDLMHPDDLERVFSSLKNKLSQGEGRDEVRYRRKDGTYAWLNATGTVIPGEAGEASLIMVCQDISAQKQSSASRTESQHDLTTASQGPSPDLEPALAAVPSPGEADGWTGGSAQRWRDIAISCTEDINEIQLLTAFCQTIVDKVGYSLAWVGFILDDEHQKVKPVASAGKNSGYLAKLNISLEDPKRGAGPTGQAIRSRLPVVIPSLKKDENFAPWCKDALRRGFKSSMAIPIFGIHGVIGALNVYSDRVDGFGEEEQKLMVEMADKLTWALNTLREEAGTQ